MTEGLKDLIFSEERYINGEPQYKLINWLTKDEVEIIARVLSYEEVTIITKRQEVRAER